jgi:hypothetical protein
MDRLMNSLTSSTQLLGTTRCEGVTFSEAWWGEAREGVGVWAERFDGGGEATGLPLDLMEERFMSSAEGIEEEAREVGVLKDTGLVRELSSASGA